MFRADTAAVHALVPAVLASAKFRKKTGLIRGGFSIFAAFADVFVVFASAASVALLHKFAYGDLDESVDLHLWMCGLVSALFVTISAFRNDYTIAQYLNAETQIRRSIAPWCTAFTITLVIALLVASPTSHRLLPTASLFVTGFAGVSLARLCLAYGVRIGAEQGRIAAKRLFLIGFEAELESFTQRWEPHRFGMQIVAASVLRGPLSLDEDLALARAYARILTPDDVFVLVPWSDKVTIDATINAFLGIPAALHLGPEKILDRFADARITKIGPFFSLDLVHSPQSHQKIMIKRAIDLFGAFTGLILLAPLLLIVAAAIKLDSPGPILFQQRRYGFNQQPFKIFKFRTMNTLEDDSKLVQVSVSDPRVTRVGAFLRRFNIDELPQLLNVIRGEMSLVGPRPMAVVHDQMYEPTIALYARRHNVKPGITGWAQINGCRGGLSDEKIRARIKYDLYYIDHWSLWFDIEILWLTLASKQGYRGAF